MVDNAGLVTYLLFPAVFPAPSARSRPCELNVLERRLPGLARACRRHAIAKAPRTFLMA